ncbi:DNA-binding protein WhiA [Carboxydocella sp. JDF658]|uniref:DNA-binding protein WhiA n=1 Tax=Carboxydocella sp. JDF658 TaxID=1926600 RepID=UPI0009AE7750|nr:DNA-binding protein WhiA [Carboxydocella sp. JDF658]GAW31374.1 DNA-binding protein WhiA [Carboxydocella sp. JDF658]
MSFSLQTKEELARLLPPHEGCLKAELAALIKMDGSLQLSAGTGWALSIHTESAAIARKVFSLLKKLFGVQADILVSKQNRLKKHNTYIVKVADSDEVKKILLFAGVLDERGELWDGIADPLLTRDCCKRAYLRGAFLGGGSVNDPERDYHLEIIVDNQEDGEAIVNLLRDLRLKGKLTARKNNFVVYLKEAEQIADFLSLIGANRARLELENARVVKEMRNNVNRLVNCETANLSKTVNAAVRQLENIRLLAERVGLSNLPEGLRQVAEARLNYPDISLKELGELLEPPLSKSGVNHRLRKLEQLASRLLQGEKGE